MYYLSGNQKGRKYGVVDSEDGAEDYLTMSEILTAESRGYKIYGLLRKCGYLYCFGMNKVLVDLISQRCPVPVMLKIAQGVGFVQTVYMGYRILSGVLEFVFFDDSGMTGLCILSNEHFLTGGAELDFVNLDYRRAEVLLRRLKDSGSFAL